VSRPAQLQAPSPVSQAQEVVARVVVAVVAVAAEVEVEVEVAEVVSDLQR